MATQEISPELDEDVFDLTEIISSDDDILDLSIEDKVEDSSSAPNEASTQAPQAEEAPAQAPPPPRPAPSNALEAEDMELDDLLNQLESGEDLKDENYGLPQQAAPQTDDLDGLDDLDDLGDITAAINAKREAFDADLASVPAGNSSASDEEGADLDDLLAGLDTPDVGSSAPASSSGADDLDNLDDLFDGLDDIAPEASSGGDDLDDLGDLFDGLDDMGAEASGGGDGLDDLDDMFGELENAGGQEAIAESGDLEDEFADFDSSALTPVSEREEEVVNLDDLESMLDAEAPIKPKNDDPFADLDDFLDELETTSTSAPVEDALDGLDSIEEDLDFADLANAAMDTDVAAVPPKQKDPLEDNDELEDINELFEELEEQVEKPITAAEDIDSLLGEFAEVTSPVEEAKDDDFIDDLDDFIKDTDVVLDPIIDDAILDIDTSEEAESIEFTNEEDLEEEIIEENTIEEDSDISSYIDEFDVLPNQDEEILTVEEAPAPSQAQTASTQFVQAPIAQAFDNTNNQTQLNLLFAEFRLLGSEIAELKRKDRTNDKDIFLPVVGKELSCKDVEENLAALRTKLANFEQSLSSMQEDVQNVASELAVDAEGEERSSIDNFIIEMSESFDNFSKSLTLFDNKISEMEKANTEMETSMTVLRTKVEKNAAKIELLSTRLDNVDATFANLENIVANTAARIIREELAAMLAEESGDTYQEPINQSFDSQTFEEVAAPAEEMSFDTVDSLDDLDDISLDMPELDLMENEEADMSGLDESLADVMDDMMPSIADVMDTLIPDEEINLDEMLDAPIETIAQESPAVSEEIDPFEAMSEQAGASEVTANAAPEDFDMDALFDTEEK